MICLSAGPGSGANHLGDRLGTLRFLIHDRDPLFTAPFGEVFKSEGLRIITTLPRMPRMNAICERVIGTHRRELLDRTLILGERYLDLVLHEYLIQLQPAQTAPVRQQPPGHRDATRPGRDRPAIRPPKTRDHGTNQRISSCRVTPAQAP